MEFVKTVRKQGAGFVDYMWQWQDDETLIGSILNLPKEMFEIKVPTLVIWGEEDPALLTGNLDGLEDYIEDLTVTRIPDGTHWVIHEQPELINSLIRDFIK